MNKLYLLAIQFIGTAKSLVLTCSFVSGRINLPLAWLTAAFVTSLSPHFGLRLQHVRSTFACTSSHQTATCEIFLTLFFSWHISSFLKTQWTKRILNYLIENAWKSGSTLLWLGFTVVTSHSNVLLKTQKNIHGLSHTPFAQILGVKSSRFETTFIKHLIQHSFTFQRNIRLNIHLFSIFKVESLFRNRPQSFCR